MVLQFETLEDIGACLHTARDQANHRLAQILQRGAKSLTEKLLLEGLNSELSRVELVRSTMSALTGEDSTHGWSKDLVHLATMVLAHRLNGADLVQDLLQRETERHFEQEHHHPESMDYTQRLMSSQLILEMAVDRMSSNLVQNQGQMDLQQMLSQEPRVRWCPGCRRTPSGGKCQHEEDLLRTYWRHVYKNVDLVRQQWGFMAGQRGDT